MKLSKLTTVLVLTLASLTSFGQSRVLTQTEKETLSADAVFKFQCEWAVKEFATYWVNQTGVGCASETACIEWSKNRLLAVRVLTKGIPTFGDITLADVFLDAAKAKQLDYGAGTPTSTAIIQKWLDNATFEEMTQYFYKVWGNDVDMSIGN